MSLSCKTHRPTQYQQITDGVTYTSSYQYNLSGAMTQETYPSGRVVKNTFDSNGNVARVFGKATPSSVEKTYANSFNYNASGGISAMRLGNGKWETAKFNKRLQVTELGLGHASQDASLWKVNYEFGEYDSNNGLVDTSKNTGNIAKQTVSFNGLAQPFVQTYEYDSLYRLKLAKEEVNGQTDPNWSQSFTYDRYGNRLTHVKEINGSPITHNQQTHPSIDASTNRFSDTNQFGYDKAGNLIADADGRTFTFDGNNKQILVTGSNGTVGEYFYDGDGMRVKKHVYTGGNHTKTVIFVYSGGKLAEEYSNDPVTSPKTKYLTEDHLGTPRIITDETGEVVSRRDFMPFGQEIAKTTGTRSDSSFKYSSNEDDVKQKFTGYQKDEETGLDFAEARMYENRHARFTAVDPLLASGNSASPQTFNRYVYVTNSPLMFSDPTGLFRDWVSANGETFFDSRVTDTESAKKYHGSDAYRLNYDHEFLSKTGDKFVLGQNGYAWINGNQGYFGDAANSSNGGSGSDLTDVDKFGREFKASILAAAKGIPKGLANFGINTANFVKDANPICRFFCSDIPRFQYNNPREASYGSAGETAPAIYTLKGGSRMFSGGAKSTSSVVPKTNNLGTAGSIRKVNPTGAGNNCVVCAIATDSRLGGLSKAPAMASRPLKIGYLEQIYGGRFVLSSQSQITRRLGQLGDGARVIVFGSRKNKVGHVFNGVNQKGKVRFLDGQTGKPANWKGNYVNFYYLRTN